MRRRMALLTIGGALATLAGCVESDGSSADDHGDTNTSTTNTSNGPAGTTAGDPPEWAPEPSGDSVVELVGPDVDRPACSVESETIAVDGDDERETETTITYPDVADFDSAVEYVEQFEESYVRHDALCDHSGHILSIGYTVAESETLEQFEDATVVYLMRYGGATSGVSEPGEPMWVVELAPKAVVYAIDESGVARVVFEDAYSYESHERTESAPDPREEGVLVERFE